MVLLAIMLLLYGVTVFLFIKNIVKRDRGRKEPLSALWTAFGFGLLALVLASFLNDIFIPKEVIDLLGEAKTVPIAASKLFGASMLVGLIEESVKCIPLALFLYRKSYFDEVTDGVIYFGLVALTFGIIEDLIYAAQYGSGIGIVRILLSPYLHAGFTVLFGIGLSRKKILQKSWAIVLVGYAGSILAHGLYDFATFSGGVVGGLSALTLTVSLNILLFVLFRKAQVVDESRGQSAVGINKYCRSCGKKNPERLLYCTYCGNLS